MKKIAFLFLIAALLINSCKKSNGGGGSTNNRGGTTTNVVLITEIIDNNPGDKDFTGLDHDSVSTGYGQPVFQFTYSGTQLTKAVHYLSSQFNQTYLFSYNSQGQCTGTTISQYLNGQMLTATQIGDSVQVRSTITYTGSNIGEQKFYTTNNVLYDDVTYTWKNNELLYLIDNPSAIADYLPYADTYVYDSNNNNVNLIVADGLTPANPSSGGQNFFLTFDNNNNISAAFPFWWVILGPDATYANFAFGPLGSDTNNPNTDIITVNPGAHNPLTDANGDVYTYQYNSYNYPSVETVTNGSQTESVKYNYIEVN